MNVPPWTDPASLRLNASMGLANAFRGHRCASMITRPTSVLCAKRRADVNQSVMYDPDRISVPREEGRDRPTSPTRNFGGAAVSCGHALAVRRWPLSRSGRPNTAGGWRPVRVQAAGGLLCQRAFYVLESPRCCTISAKSESRQFVLQNPRPLDAKRRKIHSTGTTPSLDIIAGTFPLRGKLRNIIQTITVMTGGTTIPANRFFVPSVFRCPRNY